MTTKNVPNATKKTSVIVLVAAVNTGFRKNRRSSIGSALRNSQPTNIAITTVGTAKVTSVSVESHPRSGASMIV